MPEPLPERLHFTADERSNELIAQDPFALLIGFALDQQITVQKAFSGPAVIQDRVGSLQPAALADADLDLEAVFREKPAVHRFPGAMAKRVADLSAFVDQEYGGDASRIWTEAADSEDLRLRLSALPGFGEMKVMSLASVLAKRLGVKVAAGLVPDHPTLGDVDSAQALAEYQAQKRAYKASLRGGAAVKGD